MYEYLCLILLISWAVESSGNRNIIKDKCPVFFIVFAVYFLSSKKFHVACNHIRVRSYMTSVTF